MNRRAVCLALIGLVAWSSAAGTTNAQNQPKPIAIQFSTGKPQANGMLQLLLVDHQHFDANGAFLQVLVVVPNIGPPMTADEKAAAVAKAIKGAMALGKKTRNGPLEKLSPFADDPVTGARVTVDGRMITIGGGDTGFAVRRNTTVEGRGDGNKHVFPSPGVPPSSPPSSPGSFYELGDPGLAAGLDPAGLQSLVELGIAEQYIATVLPFPGESAAAVLWDLEQQLNSHGVPVTYDSYQRLLSFDSKIPDGETLTWGNTDAGLEFGASLGVVPEPGTLTLAILGGAALAGALAWSRKRRAGGCRGA